MMKAVRIRGEQTDNSANVPKISGPRPSDLRLRVGVPRGNGVTLAELDQRVALFVHSVQGVIEQDKRNYLKAIGCYNLAASYADKLGLNEDARGFRDKSDDCLTFFLGYYLTNNQNNNT
jgi:hypothetical protein